MNQEHKNLISLEIMFENKRLPIWENFCKFIENRYEQARQNIKDTISRQEEVDLYDKIFDDELALYGAWSDWNRLDDPLFFPDKDSLTRFLLTWS